MHEEENIYLNSKNNLIKAFSTNRMNISQNSFSKTIKGNFKQRLIKTNKTNFNSLVNIAYISNSTHKINKIENPNLNKIDCPLFSPKIKKHFKRYNETLFKTPKTKSQLELMRKNILKDIMKHYLKLQKQNLN